MPERADIIVGSDSVARCGWVGADDEYIAYHDDEWGRPLRGDQGLFEKISLEAFQSGLSWITILRRRDAFREAFHDFDIAEVAGFGDDDVARLMEDPRIIRNRAKIVATIANAGAVLTLTSGNAGALDELVWSFAPARGRRPRTLDELPASTAQSLAMSVALKAIGCSFVGPTTMYALMQSSGMVDDHLHGCWRAV